MYNKISVLTLSNARFHNENNRQAKRKKKMNKRTLRTIIVREAYDHVIA